MHTIHQPWLHKRPRSWSIAALLLALTLAVPGLGTPTATANAVTANAVTAAQYRQIGGTLPDGSEYLIRVPENWNGVLINDLDFVTRADGPWYQYLLDHGYAASGTRRHPMRWKQYDPLAEINNQVRVIDLVEQQFGQADTVIQFGCSGGGAVALGIGETYPNKVDGVIPTGAQTGIVIANMWLDLAFVLKALLAPNSALPVVNIAREDAPAAVQAWHEVLDSAQQTAEGRARIALAVTLAQWPTWSSSAASTTPRPDPQDTDAVQRAMYRTARDGIQVAVTTRHLFENSAGGVASWNKGVNYKRFFSNADPGQRSAVGQLYSRAGMDPGRAVESDLRIINESPRITANPEAVEYWRTHPRTHAADPAVPVLHIHTIGDATLPPSLMQGYQSGVGTNGKTDLYRQAFVEATGHCTYNISEVTTAIQTMLQRIDTGNWGNTTNPIAMNALGRTFGVDEPRFTEFRLTPLNRAFYPDTTYPPS